MRDKYSKCAEFEATLERGRGWRMAGAGGEWRARVANGGRRAKDVRRVQSARGGPLRNPCLGGLLIGREAGGDE